MRVAVVGLGFAGLTCARALRGAGINVVGLEARPEPGGRVRTATVGGVSVEVGGEWVDGDHPRIVGLLTEFGLNPISASPLPGALHYRGELLRDEDPWPDVADEEARFVAESSRLATALPFDEGTERSLDNVPLSQFLANFRASERGRWLIGARLRSDEGEDLDRISTLGWLYGWRNYLNRSGGEMSALRVPGGLAGLAERLATASGADLRFNQPVSRAVFTESGVEIEEHGHFDRVVLALPPPVIAGMDVELPEPQRSAMSQLGFARVSKIALRYSRPFWLDRGFSGRLLTDGPLQQLWAGPEPASGILSAYIVGEASARWAGEGDPVLTAVAEVGKIFPDSPDLFVAGGFVNWAADPLAQGGFPYLPVGYVTQHLPHLGRPCGRIHFAGDWRAQWMGFVEGAIESGEATALEVLDAT